MKDRPYVGQITHGGSQVVKGSLNNTGKTGKGVVNKGNDLRNK